MHKIGLHDISNIFTKKYDFITANLPYISEDNLINELRHEPSEALYAGDKGLFLIKNLIEAEINKGSKDYDIEFIRNHFSLLIPVVDWFYSWFWNVWVDFVLSLSLILSQTFKAVVSTWIGLWILKKIN